MNNKKRKFLLQSISTITLSMLGSASQVLSEWKSSDFAHKELSELMNSLTNSTSPIESEDIYIKAPEIAENGAVVPVTINSSIDEVTNITIIVDNNPSPLTSSFNINPMLEAYVSTRVKMAKSSNIIALVTTKSGKHFSASKGIKVTIGGCGG